MSRKNLSVEQDLQEQARILREDPEQARNRLHALYRKAGLDVPDRSCALRSDAPRLIDNPAGLALSGGGIRSATFNLGVLQALHEKDLLGGFDYLSTVSGGGYLGGFWSKWRALQQKQGVEPLNAEARSRFPSSQDDSIRHLRSFSNFLRPRLSLISFETGRMATGFIVGLVPTLLVTLGVMSLALISWLGLASFLTEPSRGGATLVLLGILVTSFVIFQILWAFWAQGEESLGTEPLAYAGWVSAIMLLACLLWFGLWPVVPLPMELRLAPVAIEAVGVEHLAAAILPSLTLLVPFLLLVGLRPLLTRFVTSFRRRRLLLTTLESALDRTLFLTLVWCGVGVAWVGGQVVAGSGLSGVLSAVSVSGVGSGLLVWARRFLRPQPNKPAGGRALAFLGTSSLQVLAYFTLLGFLLFVASLLSMAYGAWGFGGLGAVWGISLFLAMYPFLFNSKEIGFHSFYRQRLVRAYLGAADKDFCGPDKKKEYDATLECESDDARLEDMPIGSPLHLICCAANDLAGDPIQSLHRGAGSSVLSGLGIQVENTWHAWADRNAESKAKRFLAPSLGSAMTASAAAFNSHMGSLSMKLGQAATFLLTALNLRLGMWADNPRSEQGRGRWIPSFYRELLGLSDLKAAQVHLSDGAHFDNLALYELIRRRCRFIVVCDCGGDPDYAFDDFANAVRRVRTDFGAEIDLDTEVLRPDEGGLARQSIVSGTVNYQDGNRAILVLVKPALTGDEPADVRQYSRRNSDFPQETTADQFYDEEQWESYRRLGEHSVFRALAQVGDDLSPPQSDTNRGFKAPTHPQAAKLIWAMAQGAYQWSASPEKDPSAVRALESQWAGLEASLAEDQNASVLAEQVLMPKTKWPGRPQDLDDFGAWIAPLTHLRKSFLLMESVLKTHNLDGARSNPESFGWMNRIGPWATSDAAYAWWPWLAPTVSRRLRTYLQSEFGLPAVRKTRAFVRPVSEELMGYATAERDATATWFAQLEPPPETDKEPELSDFEKKIQGLDHCRFGLMVPMVAKSLKDDPVRPFELMAAMATLYFSADGKTVYWRESDFFIPAGLWSSGFAKMFLEELCEALPKERANHRSLESLEVGFGKPPGAIAVALYAGAGFKIHRTTAILKLSKGKNENGLGTECEAERNQSEEAENRGEVKLLAEAPDETAP